MSKRHPREPSASPEPDDIPLHHQRPFGAGLKRKRVEFVKAALPDESTTTTPLADQNVGAIGDLYASIVMGSSKSATPVGEDGEESNKTNKQEEKEADVCEICGNAVGGSRLVHEATLAHQVSLAHSHPPSHLDRKRMGVKTLKSQGWDPDARKGLGSQGEGRRFPIKVAAKEDTLGIGATVPERKEREEKVKLLDAKQVRKMEERERKRREKLSREVYGRVDVEGYLRGDVGGGDGLR